MSSRNALVFILILFIAQPALAHGPARAYDPLVVEMHGYLTPTGWSETAPEIASVAFPADGAPLTFEFAAPVRFASVGGFHLDVAVRAEKPVVGRDADGNALEFTIEPGGGVVRAKMGEALLAPGATARVRGVIKMSTVSFEEGTPIRLSVRPLMPGLTEDALSITSGPEGSRLDVLDMRIPAAADLGLNPPGLATVLATVAPRGENDAVIDVKHDRTTLGNVPANATRVWLIADESEPDAARHAYHDRERRLAAAHTYRVDGVLVRVHPGVAVGVPLPRLPARIECVLNCPADGFLAVLGTSGPVESVRERPSALVPPPRETRGVPVSEDEPAAREAPAAPAWLLLALFGSAALAYRKR